jgi:hypothetical protein
MKRTDAASNVDSFYRRAVDRMAERGIIDAAARSRLLESGEPTDPHSALGAYQALLAVALWPTNEGAVTPDKARKTARRAK